MSPIIIAWISSQPHEIPEKLPGHQAQMTSSIDCGSVGSPPLHVLSSTMIHFLMTSTLSTESVSLDHSSKLPESASFQDRVKMIWLTQRAKGGKWPRPSGVEIRYNLHHGIRHQKNDYLKLLLRSYTTPTHRSNNRRSLYHHSTNASITNPSPPKI